MDVEDLDLEELDRLIEWLVEYRRRARGDCAFDCETKHIHKRNGVSYITRTTPLRRGK